MVPALDPARNKTTALDCAAAVEAKKEAGFLSAARVTRAMSQFAAGRR
jgi:hypothetical protein